RLGPRRVRPAHARIEPVPARAERPRPRVVDLLGIEVEVEPRRLVDELELRQRRRALLLHEGREALPQRPVDAVVLGPELVPAGARRSAPRRSAPAMAAR